MNIVMLILLSAILILSFFMLAMLVVKLRFDLAAMYDKYAFERVKRLDAKRQYEMDMRPHTTRTEYLTRELFDDIKEQIND